MTFDEIARGLTNAINKYKDKMVGVGEIRIDDMAEDCLRFIQEQQKQLDEEISRRYQAECNYDNWKKQAMEYKEKLEQFKARQPKWMPVTLKYDTEHGKDMLEGSLPDDEQIILVTNGKSVWEETFLRDREECYLDSGLALGSEVIAWQPLPEPYKGDEE